MYDLAFPHALQILWVYLWEIFISEKHVAVFVHHSPHAACFNTAVRHEITYKIRVEYFENLTNCKNRNKI